MKKTSSLSPITLLVALLVVFGMTTSVAAAISYDLYGYRANEGGGGSLDTGWTKGNLGNTWSEGEWVPYMLVIENPDGAALADQDSIIVSFDFTRPHSADHYRFVDLIRSIQVGTVARTDAQGWVHPSGGAFSLNGRDSLEIAQNYPNEEEWSDMHLLNLPHSQVNRKLDGGLDVPPGEDRHIFYFKRSDLVPFGLQDAQTIVIYWQLHESRTFVWSNSLQEQYNYSNQTNDWGGYLYSTDDWPDSAYFGSGYVPGSSGHIHLEDVSGSKDVPIPIPERLPGLVTGFKWLDQNGNGLFDGEQRLSGWRLYVSGELEGVVFTTDTLTDDTGYYSFPNLTSGTVWHICEEPQREIPAESGYMQTYPTLSDTVGVGVGASCDPPQSMYGWDVSLTVLAPDQPNMNFGNKLCELSCTSPPDTSVHCTGDWSVTALGMPTVDYNCPPIDTTFTADTTGTCPTTIHRMWTFTDFVGNSSMCDQWITIVDTTVPILTVPPDTVFECVMGDPGTATAWDDCEVAPGYPSYSDEVLNSRCPYEIRRIWTAMDTCGNSVVDTQFITVQDTADPSITAPADVVFDCVMGDAGVPTDTSDNCAIDSVGYSDNVVSTRCPYIVERTWTAWDTCGNSSSDIQLITVQDTANPWINAPADVVFDCEMGDPLTADDYGDNCYVDSITYSDNVLSPRCPYIVERTWTVWDSCGQWASDVQLITVQDSANPSITAPPDAAFDCVMGDPGQPTDTSDNCAVDSVNFSDNVVSTRCPYVVERTWNVWDTCGNMSSDVQIITVQDTTNPTVTAPPDTSFDCVMGNPGLPTDTSDNCWIDSVNYSDNVVSTRCPYVIERTWKVWDSCGNMGSDMQTITVQDTANPTITVPPDATFDCVMGDPGLPTDTSDNCAVDSVAYSDSTVSDRCPYVIERTWKVWDTCGNMGSDVQTITVQDTTSPTITCVDTVDTIPCGNTAVFTDPDVTDNCDTLPTLMIVLDTSYEGSAFNETIYRRCWAAVDSCGNTSDTCCQEIIEICEEPCTFTMGGWGSGCPESQADDWMSTQPGCIRDHYFGSVFPGGVLIGDQAGPGGGNPNRYAALWTNASAVDNFLPAGGTPSTLDQDYTNPTTTSGGVLAGQLLALKLNVGYTCAGVFADLGIGDASCYDSAIIGNCGNSKFNGITVDSFLTIADKAISGQVNILNSFGATLSDLNYTATCLNELHDNCDPTAPAIIVAADEDQGTSEAAMNATETGLPAEFSLSQNYPNPFNPTTEITFALPQASHVKLEIFNIIGQNVLTLIEDDREAGVHTVVWDGSNVASGIYLYRLIAGNFVETKKMILLK